MGDVGLGERVGNRGGTERRLRAEGTRAGMGRTSMDESSGWGWEVKVEGQASSLAGARGDTPKQMPAGYGNGRWKPMKFISSLSPLLSSLLPTNTYYRLTI